MRRRIHHFFAGGAGGTEPASHLVLQAASLRGVVIDEQRRIGGPLADIVQCSEPLLQLAQHITIFIRCLGVIAPCQAHEEFHGVAQLLDLDSQFVKIVIGHRVQVRAGVFHFLAVVVQQPRREFG